MFILRLICSIFWIFIFCKYLNKENEYLSACIYMLLEITWIGAIIISLNSQNISLLPFILKETFNIIIIFGCFFIWRFLLKEIINNYIHLNKHSECAINFNKFLSLYNIAPEKWDCSENYLIYEQQITRYEKEIYHFRFKTLFDYLKYIAFLNDMRKNHKIQKMENTLAAVTKYWLKDIEDYKEANSIKF